MELMFLEALQAYYAPAVVLVAFTVVLVTDQLLTRQEKKMFLLELGVVGLMLLSTWVDRCVSAITTGEWWHLRFFTSALQFAMAPLSPLILLRIYSRNNPGKIGWIQGLPAIITALLAMTSFWTGLVLKVEPGNIYSRGPLFLLPFFSSAIYIVFIIRIASRKDTSGRKRETGFLFYAGAAIAGACTLEIVFVIRYMIWSTTAVLLLIYFLVITILKVLYDSQTGVYSRLAYTKRMESVKEGEPLTLAMIDMNGLKQINDSYGHKAGDEAIAQISKVLLELPVHQKKLYRYGGDEFVIVMKSWCGKELETELEKVASGCGVVNDTILSFAYGVIEYHGGSLHKVTDEMDCLMYQKKLEMKSKKTK